MHAPSSSGLSENLQMFELAKTGLVERGPIFRPDDAKSQFLVLSAPKNVPKESRWRFRDFLLLHNKHPGKSSSHISIQDNKMTSDTTTYFCSTKCLFQSLMGIHPNPGSYVSWNSINVSFTFLDL